MLLRLSRLLCSALDPRPWLHIVRLVHFVNYSHVAPRRRVDIGAGAQMAPNVSLRNGERISIGARAHIGERCSLWAGDRSGQIRIGEDALFGPEVFITASNYETRPGMAVMRQPTIEQDVVIGRDVWLGARVIVVPGVVVGDGCIVGAGSVVTRSLPAGSIAVGAPAAVVGQRS